MKYLYYISPLCRVLGGSRKGARGFQSFMLKEGRLEEFQRQRDSARKDVAILGLDESSLTLQTIVCHMLPSWRGE